MATNKFYITAGLQVSKDSGTVPAAGKNTYYIAAGLPPVYVAAATSSRRRRLLCGSHL
jgi:hypothetical protein